MTNFLETLFGRTFAPAARGTLLDRLHATSGLYRSRARLAALEPHMLADIGLSEKDAKSESDRPFWDAPANWKR